MKKRLGSTLLALVTALTLIPPSALSALAPGVPANPYAVVTCANGATQTVNGSPTANDEADSISLPTFWVGQSYTVELRADNEPQSWIRSIYGEIDGMTFDGGAGVLSGTPAEGCSGYWIMHAENASGRGKTLWLNYLVLSESQKPAITTASLPGGIIGSEYNQTIGFSGYYGSSRTWSVSSGTLPPGVELGVSGFDGWLHGTPEAAGTYTFTVQMENAAGIAEKQYTVEVLSELQAPKITNGPAYAVRGEAFSFQMTATTDPRAQNVWSADGLPAGLTISESGLISGAPDAAGNDAYARIYLHSSLNGARASDSTYFTFPVYERPAVTTAAAQTGRVGEPLTIPFTSTGSDGVWSASGEPEWLHFSNDSLWGTPEAAGAYRFTLTDTVAEGLSASKEITLTVSDVPGMNVPNKSDYAFPGMVAGYETAPSYRFTVQNTGTAAASFSAALTTGTNFTLSPASQSIAAGESGAFTVTPNAGLAAGTYHDTVTVSTSGVPSVSFGVSFTVAAEQTDAAVDTGVLDPNGYAHYAVVGKYYEFQLAATGTGPFTWAIDGGALPDGLSLDASGKISGTPTAASIEDGLSEDTIACLVTVTGATGNASSSTSITIKIIRPPQLQLPENIPAECYAGSEYKTTGNPYYFSGTNNESLTWTLVGNVPDGIGLADNSTWANLSGTPATPGFYIFTVRGAKYEGEDVIGVVEHEITLTVYGALTFTDSDDLDLTGLVYGEPFPLKDLSLAVTGGKAPLTFAYDSGTGTLAGLTLSDKGVVSGTPNVFLQTAPNIKVTVTDANGMSSDIRIKRAAVAPPAPTLNRQDGSSFLNSITMRPVDVPNGCEFYYSVGSDSDPVNNGVYCTYHTFTDTVTVRTVLFNRASGAFSEVVTATYTKVSAPAAPTSSDSESFVGWTFVHLTCPTDGAIIYYTTDGSTPDETSKCYSTSFLIKENTTVKAKAALAVDGEYVFSDVFTKAFTLVPGGNVTGTVYAANGSGIPFTVTLKQGDTVLDSKSGGLNTKFDYTFKSVPNGTYTLAYERYGCETVTREVTVAGESVTLPLVTLEAASVAATGVSLGQTAVTLAVGGSVTLIAAVAPNNATNKNVTWSSSDTKVAVVDANGKVTAVKAGTATVTVRTVDGDKTATCAVSVTGIASASVENTTLTCTLTGVPANARLIAAWYDGGGRMLGATGTDAAEGNSTKTLTADANTAAYRLMLVDKTTFAPLCAAWSG